MACEDHPSEKANGYCATCERCVCAVCPIVTHSGHLIESLSSLAAARLRSMRPMTNSNDSTYAQLLSLEHQVLPLEEALHSYIEQELDVLEQVLEDKRGELRNDVSMRVQEMEELLWKEEELCISELRSFDCAQDVLQALSRGEGLSAEPLGRLIQGSISYEEFIHTADVEVHKPHRMLHLLGLQLPMQNLQDMCDLITWTPLSVQAAPQIFPSDQ